MSSFTQGETSDFQAQNFMSADAQSILNAASNNALLPIENYNYGFGSNATNLEYSILSNMLGSPLVDAASTSTPNVQQNTLNNIWAPSPIKTYIYELMSNPSAVEYWEKYALHAFDNTDSAVYSTCILMSPTKRVVPCTFCFTIKRDIFDLPSVIVGNFLPILS
ncbi:Putative Transcription activator of gluconeogenesis acuK [Rhizopus microsporus]|nr:Putative Transcription activator of gluconeogenesis acuK [Rhizopus microsporus]